MAPKIPSSPRKESEEEHSSSFRKRSSLCTFHEEDEDDYVNNYDESCVSLSIHDLQQIKEQHNNRHSDNEDNEAGHNSSSSRMRRRTSLEEDCIQTKMILAEQKTSMDSLQHQLNESQNENKLLTDVISYLRTKVDAANSQANSQAKPQASSQSSSQNNNNNEELYELRRQLLHQQHQNAKLTRQLTTATKDRNTYQTQVNHLSLRCDALSEEFHVSLDVVFQLRDRVERLTAERDALRCRLNMDVVKEDSVTLPWIGGWFSSVHPDNKADQYLKKGKVVCGDASDTFVPTSKMDGIYGYTSNRKEQQEKEQHHQQQQQHEEGPQGAVSPSSSTTELDSVTSNDDTVKASSSSSMSFSSLDTRGLFQFRRSNDNTANANTKDDSSASVAIAAAVASSANTSAAANSSARRRKPRAYSDAGLFGGLFKRGGPPPTTKTEEKCPPNNSNSNNNNAIKNTSSKFDGSSARTLFPNASSSATAVRSFRSRSFGSETPHPEYDHENSNIWSRDSGKNMTWNSNRRFGDESNEDPIRRRSVFHTGLANNSLPPSSIMDENKSKTCIARPA